MKKVILAKLDQYPILMNYLHETGYKKLVNNTAHEYWGLGAHFKGQNKYGQILTEMREGR